MPRRSLRQPGGDLVPGVLEDRTGLGKLPCSLQRPGAVARKPVERDGALVPAHFLDLAIGILHQDAVDRDEGIRRDVRPLYRTPAAIRAGDDGLPGLARGNGDRALA